MVVVGTRHWKRSQEVESSNIMYLHDPFGIERDELVSAFQRFETIDGRIVRFYFMNDGGDVWIPNTDLVIKARRKQ